MLSNLWSIIRMNLSKLSRDERGVTVIEYAAIAALILVASIVLIGNVGNTLNGVWSAISDALSNATPS